MAVNAPKATEAHPIVLRMVDLFSFMIRLLFLSALLILIAFVSCTIFLDHCATFAAKRRSRCLSSLLIIAQYSYVRYPG